MKYQETPENLPVVDGPEVPSMPTEDIPFRDQGTGVSVRMLDGASGTSARKGLGMWSVEDVAAFLEVSQATVFRLVAQRRLAHYALPRGMRFKPEDVDAYVESVRAEATNDKQHGEKDQEHLVG